jgi:hypothetical protein
MCNETDCLQAHINKGDKIPSWDGEIHYHPKNDDSKKGLMRIPVQVKGTSGEPKTENETPVWNIDKVDLDNYLRNNGCIFLLCRYC